MGAEGGKASEAGPRLALSGCSKEGSVAGMSGKGEGGYETGEWRGQTLRVLYRSELLCLFCVCLGVELCPPKAAWTCQEPITEQAIRVTPLLPLSFGFLHPCTPFTCSKKQD